MGKSLTFSALLLVSFNSLAIPAMDLFRQARPAIPIIFSGGGICAGASLEGNLILTAAHCVDRMRGVRIAFPGKKIERVIDADVIAFERESDLALLRPRELSGAPTLKVATEDATLEPGIFLATIGHPLGAVRPRYDTEDFTEYLHYYSAGALAKLTRQELVMAITVGHGNSGGPVLNEKGELVSVISRIANAFVYSPTPRMVREFVAKYSPQPAPAISEWRALNNWDLYLWVGGHSYMEKLSSEGRGLSFGELAWNWADRVGVQVGANGGGTYRYSSAALSWRHAHQTENPMTLMYSVIGLESATFSITDPTDPKKIIAWNGPGVFYILNSGRSGFAVRAAVHQLKNATETQLAIGVFF